MRQLADIRKEVVMRSFKTLSLVASTLLASSAMVQAADIIGGPPIIEELPPEISVPTSSGAGGWYIRGDISYASLDHEGVQYFQGPVLSGTFNQHELDSTWAIQGGIGYQVTDYFRVDATLKYFGDSDFDGSSALGPDAECTPFDVPFGNHCSFNDDTELESALVFMANAYVDLGTFKGITPYVGAGIGGAHVSYGDLVNDQTCVGTGSDDEFCSLNDFTHAGNDEFRFAWAVHAGASFDLSCRTKLDAGYTFTRIEGGRMFGGGIRQLDVAAGNDIVDFGGNGFDDGIDIHEGRIGLRYQLDDAGCHQPSSAPPPIVYK